MATTKTYARLNSFMREVRGMCEQSDVITVHTILMALRYTNISMYVVVTPTHHMFVTNNYACAMHYNDKHACDVYSVWRDDMCVWHATKQ